MVDTNDMLHTDKLKALATGLSNSIGNPLCPGLKLRCRKLTLCNLYRYRDITQQPMPSTIQPYISETTEFCRKMHAEVLYNILKRKSVAGFSRTAQCCARTELIRVVLLRISVCALGLGLPEDELVKRHTYEGHDASWFRYMAYYDEYDEEEEKATKGLWCVLIKPAGYHIGLIWK